MQRNCPHCGATVSDTMKFCTACGAQLQQLCPTCGKPRTPGSNFCIYCGSRVQTAQDSASAPSSRKQNPPRQPDGKPEKPSAAPHASVSAPASSPSSLKPSGPEPSADAPSSPAAEKKAGNKRVVIPVLVACLALAVVVFAWRGMKTPGSSGSSSSSSGQTGEDGQSEIGVPVDSTASLSFVTASDELIEPYSSILQLYVTASRESWEPARMLMQGLNAHCSGLRLFELGYAFADLDGDGSPEMLVGNASDVSAGEVFDLYTMRSGTPSLLAQSGDTERYSFCTDGTLRVETESDASETRTAFYRPGSSGTLDFIEAVVHNAKENTWRYTTEEDSEDAWRDIRDQEASAILQKRTHAIIPFSSLSDAAGHAGITDPFVPQLRYSAPSQPRYLMPTDTRVIEESELYGYTEGSVTQILYEIYARHGCTFDDIFYRACFTSQSWYKPVEGLTLSNFDTSVLNGYELKNIEIIENYLKRMQEETDSSVS